MLAGTESIYWQRDHSDWCVSADTAAHLTAALVLAKVLMWQAVKAVVGLQLPSWQASLSWAPFLVLQPPPHPPMRSLQRQG